MDNAVKVSSDSLFKLSKQIENCISHMDFLGKCQILHVVPKGFNLGKNRFHSDLVSHVKQAGQVLIQGQINRLLQTFSIKTFEFNIAMQNLWNTVGDERAKIIYKDVMKYANNKRAAMFSAKIKKIRTLTTDVLKHKTIPAVYLMCSLQESSSSIEEM